MLLVQDIRDDRNRIEAGLRKRNMTDLSVLDEIIKTDDLRKQTQFNLDTRLAEANSYSKKIGELYKTGKADEANELKAKSSALKDETKTLSDDLKKYKDRLDALLFQIPNVLHSSVPEGNSEEQNKEVYRNQDPEQKVGKPHWELAKDYDLINFELGNKITGAGFPFYKGKGARLQRALIQYFLDKNISAGYTEYNTPLLVNEASARGTGQLPDKEAQMYEVPRDDFYLIPTSEVTLTNIYRDVLIDESNLPIKLTAHSHCFRREAGSYGSDVRGLNRLHQFEKVELVRIEKPEDSYNAQEEMNDHVESILKELGFTYRILHLCGGDTGFAAASTFDFEVYSAAQDKWLEVSSVSNVESFQANRANIRMKGKNGNTYVHTLNGSSLALPRILAALLEINQTEDGINIPEVLRPYTGFDSISK